MSWVIRADAKTIPTEEDGILCIAVIVRAENTGSSRSSGAYLWGIHEVSGDVMSIDSKEGLRCPGGMIFDLQEVYLPDARTLSSIQISGDGFYRWISLEQNAIAWGPKKTYGSNE